MGTGASSCRDAPEFPDNFALFVDRVSKECSDLFTVSNSSADFIKFIKDGNWVDNLFKTKLLYYRNLHPKLKTCSVAFHSSTSSLAPSDADETLSSFRSVRSGRISSRQPNREPAVTDPVPTELCTVIEERTCFSGEQMMSCLFSTIYPLYLANCNTYEKLLDGEEPREVETFSYLGDQESHMLKLQDILHDASALVDESELKNALENTDWLQTLRNSVKNCPLGISVFAIKQDASANNILPVYVNDRAKKCSIPPPVIVTPTTSKTDDNCSPKALPRVRHPFLQTWGIEDDEAHEADIMYSLLLAQPLRLIAKRCVGKARVVVDVSHIFDEEGVHRYVLAVMMDIPQDSAAKRRVQYLSDTALLLSHLIKVPEGRALSSQCTRAGTVVSVEVNSSK